MELVVGLQPAGEVRPAAAAAAERDRDEDDQGGDGVSSSVG
jgi:hypothetical protein